MVARLASIASGTKRLQVRVLRWSFFSLHAPMCSLSSLRTRKKAIFSIVVQYGWIKNNKSLISLVCSARDSVLQGRVWLQCHKRRSVHHIYLLSRAVYFVGRRHGFAQRDVSTLLQSPRTSFLRCAKQGGTAVISQSSGNVRKPT